MYDDLFRSYPTTIRRSHSKHPTPWKLTSYSFPIHFPQVSQIVRSTQYHNQNLLIVLPTKSMVLRRNRDGNPTTPKRPLEWRRDCLPCGNQPFHRRSLQLPRHQGQYFSGRYVVHGKA